MSKKFEKLNEVFNVASETISSELDKVDEDIKSLSESDKRSKILMLKKIMNM